MEMDIDLDYLENLSSNTLIKIKSPFDEKRTNKSSKSKDNVSSPVQLKLRKQIEFYLSDANLYNDTFLRKMISKNSQQSVEVNTLLTFVKVK